MECKSIPSVGVSQNLVLRNFGVELLRALFLLLAYTQPAYGVWDRFFAIEAVRPVCRHLRTFAAKDFFVFCYFFAQKWDRPEPGDLDVLASLRTARPADGRSADSA
jgi:hypothetical protein